ncbi:MAG TPA: tail fiber protein [Rhodothermales bacterium]|nr:tail fiber protein [Rhodothermales bacterium]
MPIVTTVRRPSSALRALRRLRTRDALSRIPAHLLSGTDAEAVRTRAEAFGIVPGQVYRRPGEAQAPFASTPYVGELILFGGNFAPAGWAMCQGQQLAISENDALFTLLGTTYGGDGQETFKLPNLSSRLPMHMGTGGGATYLIGEMAGVESVTLTPQQIPAHDHGVPYTTNVGTQSSAVNAFPAAVPASGKPRYALASAPSVLMKSDQFAPSGGSQPHDNMSPFLVLTFCISLYGVFPSQN